MLKATGSKQILTENPYFELIKDIIYTNEVQSLKLFQHHVSTNRFQHSLNVSYYNYIICKRFGLNMKAAARAGLLHDLFYYDRKTYKSDKSKNSAGKKSYMRQHPDIALRNALNSFEISLLEKDIIEKHMFPLTLSPPKYKETMVIIMVDKFCAFMEFFQPYYKALKKYKNRDKYTVRG